MSCRQSKLIVGVPGRARPLAPTINRVQVATAGIIGGLGPLAHIIFEQRLLAASTRWGAQSDAAHPVWILVNATDIPDRTSSIKGDGRTCANALVRYARLLHGAGADFLIVACNTAHYFHEEVQRRVSLPWLNLISHTVEALALEHPQARRIGVLATEGTLMSGLYQHQLKDRGLAPVVPAVDSELQRMIMAAIYEPGWGVKSTGTSVFDRARRALHASISALADRGAEVVILGCTELSAIADSLPVGLSSPLPLVDPLDVASELVLDLSFKSAAGQRSLPMVAAPPPSEAKAP